MILERFRINRYAVLTVRKFDKNFKNILILLLGTLFSSIFPLAIMPMLTRIYSPEEFGKLEIFSSSVLLASALATLRLEFSLVLPKERDEGLEILSAAMTNNLVVSGLVFLVILLFRHDYFLIFPLFLWTYSSSEIAKKWLAREAKFNQVSTVRFIQALMSNMLRWGFGKFGLGVWGLALSAPAAQLSSLFVSKDIWRFANFKTWKSILNKYRNFAFANAPEALVLGLKEISLPIVLTTFFGEFWLGQYGLTLKVLRAPIFILGVALADVYFREFSLHLNDSKFIKRTIKKYGILILLGFTAIMVLVPPALGFVFGDKWVQAGFFIKCLSPVYFVSFINLVFMDKLPILFNRQALGMRVNVLGEIFSILVLVSCIYFNLGIEISFVFYSIVQVITKLIYTFWSWSLIDSKLSKDS